MSKSIIDEIRAAEDAAYEIRKNADIKVKETVEEALRTAENIRAEATSAAEAEYAERIAEAKKVAEARIDENRRLSYENAAIMTETSKKKTNAAVKFIVDAVLNG